MEVVSASNTLAEIHSKGSHRVWVADSSTRSIAVYPSRKEICLLAGDDELDGEDVLPGFRVGLKDIFGPRVDARRAGTRIPAYCPQTRAGPLGAPREAAPESPSPAPGAPTIKLPSSGAKSVGSTTVPTIDARLTFPSSPSSA